MDKKRAIELLEDMKRDRALLFPYDVEAAAERGHGYARRQVDQARADAAESEWNALHMGSEALREQIERGERG